MAKQSPQTFRPAGFVVWGGRGGGPARQPLGASTARPVHIGRTTQVWQIDMVNDAGELTCVSRITMAVLAPKG